MTWKLNETTIPYPGSFNVRWMEISKTGRVASGLLVKDVIAQKRQFAFDYDEITLAEKAVFDAFWAAQEFVTFTWTEAGATQTATVWMTEPAYDAYLTNPERWVNYQFVLEER